MSSVSYHRRRRPFLNPPAEHWMYPCTDPALHYTHETILLRLIMPRGPSLHVSTMVFIVMMTLVSCTTASTFHLLHRNIELQEGPINIPGMLCPTRIGKKVEVTLGGQKMMVPHVECITGNACCGEGGRGRCVQVIDNTSGKEWKRGCQCQIPI